MNPAVLQTCATWIMLHSESEAEEEEAKDMDSTRSYPLVDHHPPTSPSIGPAPMLLRQSIMASWEPCQQQQQQQRHSHRVPPGRPRHFLTFSSNPDRGRQEWKTSFRGSSGVHRHTLLLFVDQIDAKPARPTTNPKSQPRLGDDRRHASVVLSEWAKDSLSRLDPTIVTS